MKNQTLKIVIGVAVLMIIGAAFFFAGRSAQEEPDGTSSIAPTVSTSEAKRPGAIATDALPNVYTDPVIGFSFAYPAGFEVTESGLSTDRIVIASGDTQDQAFQLEVKSWHDPDKQVTVERIHRDSPGLDLRDPQTITLYGEPRGIAFVSSSLELGGDVRQIWFIMGDYLYQFTAPISSDAVLQMVLPTIVPANDQQ